MVSLGNTQVNGEFVFSGTRTDVAPFEADGSYHGNDSPFSIKVGNTSTIEVGADGADVFGTVFASLSDLKAALENDDVDGINTAMDALGKDAEHLSTRQSEIGSRALRMEMKGKILQDLQISGTERLSAIEDADMAEAITQLMSKELVYKAALATSARLMNLSLVDFVR
jgi:flagellar hook-associated protein 3 FlgL